MSGASGSPRTTVAVVVPTVGRPSLRTLLRSLRDAAPDPRLEVTAVVLIDDRPATHPLARIPLDAIAFGGRPVVDVAAIAGVAPTVVCSGGRGPAAARNAGIAATVTTPASDGRASAWVVTLDDDVWVRDDWWHRLADDLERAEGAGDDPASPVGISPVAAVFGTIDVPLPSGRRPTDWERHVARLSTARWITADAAVRREALDEVGGFDESFRRAYREDSDLALRLLDREWRLEDGTRVAVHPPRPSGLLASVAVERGNADDVRMRAKHGPSYRARLGERGRMHEVHVLTTAAAVLAIVARLAGRRRAARASLAVWVGSTAVFALRRIVPGPRDRREVAAMVVSSVAIPPAHCVHRGRGHLRRRRETADAPS